MAHKAFVSSTHEDLKDHREFVIKQLRDAGLHVDPMENWTAAAGEPRQLSQDRLEGCDLCVLLVALRRGHIAEGDTLSITQLEVAAAEERGIEVLVFLLEENAPWPRGFDELDTDPGLKAWRKELGEDYMVGFFQREPTSVPIHGAVARWLQGTPRSDVDDDAPSSDTSPTLAQTPTELRFTGAVAPDPVSVRTLVMEHAASESDSIHVRWPSTSNEILDNLVAAYDAATNRTDWFEDADDEEIGVFLRTMYRPANSIVTGIRNERGLAERRMALLLEGMIPYGWSDEYRITALMKFASLCDFKLHESAAFSLSHRLTASDLLPAVWSDWLVASRDNTALGQILGLEEGTPLWTAYVPQISGYDLGLEEGELLLQVPFETGARIANGRLTLSAWPELIIPQVEWKLLRRGATVAYGETLSVRKWRNPEGEDYVYPAVETP